MTAKYQELQKAFETNDVVYINTWSRDCDGVNATNHMKFTSFDEFCKWEDNQVEWADGPFGWEITTKDDLLESSTWGGWEY